MVERKDYEKVIKDFKTELEREEYQRRVNLQRIRRKETWMKASIVLIILLMGVGPFLYWLWTNRAN